ncbi:MAG TPA: DNA mismatch repair protein MutS, partial [Halobacteriales archaeon]|nr:DNA mismatch repair protein MutS [Halobacteriales archaeon]
MDAALGSPEGLADREELTPMMAQYAELCATYDDSLVLFHVGDFYKTFCEAAETVARVCELTLTEREDNTGVYPMAGIPVDNAEKYVETLLDAGFRIAIAEQVEDPEEASGVADRAVTRVVTPGTLTEEALLAGADNNFVACLARSKEDGEVEYGLAVLDVSTGDFYATGADSLASIRLEVGRFGPAEALVGPGVEADPFEDDCVVSTFREGAFDAEAARERVREYFGDPGDRLASDAEVRACGALLAYAEYARGAGDRLDYLNRLTRYDPREFLLLDAAALSSLELFEPRSVYGAEGTALLDVIDETACALGSRKLRDWLRRPLLDPGRIEARLDAVSELTGDVRTRERLHDLLADVYDLERLISRVSRGRANARDLRSLASTLSVVPEVEGAMADLEARRLVALRDDLDDLAETRDLIERAIRSDPPVEITEGDVIEPGYSEELDGLRETERSGKAWISDLQERERERTGIESLKVGFNAVHGYYIEVTDPNLDSVPDDYTRRQTLKNAERFYTPELKRREDEILGAAAQADDLELSLFREVRSAVADQVERVQAVARTLAEVDALASLAEVAAKHDYCRPRIVEEGLHVRAGRHPVVERTQDAFVPNDARLDADEPFVLLTGPNMSGKSTYMRQVALIQLLAQVGSFVPAAEAAVSVVDRVFTRVGASDDIAGGRSTFMIEMTEVAEILREASDRSLVLLDEVGRGT